MLGELTVHKVVDVARDYPELGDVRGRDHTQNKRNETYVGSNCHRLARYSVSLTVRAVSACARLYYCPIKLSAQRNETETKQFQNSFETVSFQFHFVVRIV